MSAAPEPQSKEIFDTWLHWMRHTKEPEFNRSVLATIASLPHFHALRYQVARWQTLCFPVTVWKFLRSRRQLSTASSLSDPRVQRCNTLLSSLEFGVPNAARAIPHHVRHAIFMCDFSHWQIRQAFTSHAFRSASAGIEVRSQPTWVLTSASLAEAAFAVLSLFSLVVMIGGVLAYAGALGSTSHLLLVGWVTCNVGWFWSRFFGRQWRDGYKLLAGVLNQIAGQDR